MRGDERAQRARRRHDRVPLAGGLEAEPPQAGADVIEAAAAGQLRGLRKPAPEGGADVVEIGTALGEEADEVLVAVGGNSIVASSGAARYVFAGRPAPGPPRPRENEASSRPAPARRSSRAAGDVAVDGVVLGQLVRRHGALGPAHEREGGAEAGSPTAARRSMI